MDKEPSLPVHESQTAEPHLDTIPTIITAAKWTLHNSVELDPTCGQRDGSLFHENNWWEARSNLYRRTDDKTRGEASYNYPIDAYTATMQDLSRRLENGTVLPYHTHATFDPNTEHATLNSFVRIHDAYTVFDPYSTMKGISETLLGGNYGISDLSSFIHTARTLCDAISETVADTSGDKPMYGDVLQLLNEGVPLDHLRATFLSDVTAIDIREMLEYDFAFDYDLSLSLVKGLYNVRYISDLLRDMKPQQDHLLDALMKRHSDIMAIWLEGEEFEKAIRQINEEVPAASREVAIRTHENEFLTRLGLSPKVRQAFRKASNERTRSELDNKIDISALSASIRQTLAVVRRVGIQKLEILHEQAGITNFDYYHPEQLNAMYRVVSGDTRAIEHLKSGDTTIVLTDAQGDYGGAFKHNAEQFETEAQRTLYFEINQPGDLHRFMSNLKKSGIQPSTLVIAAHGGIGHMDFGREYNGFSVANTNTAGVRHSSIIPVSLTASELSEIVTFYMQDSKGIDDNPAHVGRRRIVLRSCQQAALAMIPSQKKSHNTIIRKGEPYELTSIAKTLTEVIRNPHLDIYATSNKIFVERTKDGVRFLAEEEGSGKRIPSPVLHLRTEQNGNIITNQLEELPLRNRGFRATGHIYQRRI